jgi:hypothetical protein
MTTNELNLILEPYWKEGFWHGVRFNEGWNNLVYDLHKKILSIYPNYKLAQAKEKFGCLRYYYYSDLGVHIKEIDELVNEAENKSATICEDCGNPTATLYAVKRCLKTLCVNCVSKYPQELVEKYCEKYKPIILG